MDRVTKIKTADGALHDSVQDATRYAEKRYGEALSRLAHQMARLEKYVAITEFIDSNLEAFTQLKALKDDMTAPPEES